MKRREFITKVGVGSLAGAGLLAGCGEDKKAPETAGSEAKQQKFKWNMVTTWPKNFPGLGTGANNLAALITEMSGGRIEVKVYGAGELVPAFEIFDAVSKGTAQMGHGAAYYWKGKSEAAQFFAAVPFGLTAQEMNSWLYHGGGMELWREVYEPFGLIPTAAANTGVQMGGWFNKEINSLEDLSGLKMRIPGLGGEVLKRLGGTPVSLPGGEIFPSLKSGAIDATLESFINKQAFEELPEDLQSIVLNACKVANNDVLAELTARNNEALDTLVNEHNVELRKFPDDVLQQLKKVSEEVVAEIAEKDAISKKVYQSYKQFRDQVMAWHDVSERAYLNARAGV